MTTAPMLIAVRHAPLARDGVCRGRTDALPALPAAEVARRMLARLVPHRLHRVWTSPAGRCRAPAEIVATRLAIPVTTDVRLHELDFGCWEGRRWSDLEREEPDALHAWMTDWTRVSPTGGESADALLARVEAWWRGLERHFTHLLVAHAGVVRALRVAARHATWHGAMARPVPHLEPEIFPLVQ